MTQDLNGRKIAILVVEGSSCAVDKNHKKFTTAVLRTRAYPS
jgi:hypothetical protein